MTISAENFFDTWVETYSDDKHQKNLNFHWSNKKAYTNEIKNVCVDLAARLELKCCETNYYFTDHVFYKKHDSVFRNNETYIINPEIVFEHENESNSFYSEVAHHLILKSNLYVVVSYYKKNLNHNYMNTILELINMSSSADKFKEKQNFLIILGEEDAPDISKNYWKGFIFNGDNWNEINS